MTERVPDSIRDMAAAYVLGALDADEARTFEAQLARSDKLQREVAELREVSALLGETAPQVEPSPKLRARVLRDAVSARTRARSVWPRATWVRTLAWAAVVGGVALGTTQWIRAHALAGRLAELRGELQRAESTLAERDSTLARILEPGTVMIVLTSTGDAPPAVQLFWNRQANAVVLSAANLDPAPANRAYQLWYLRDGAPIPASTFDTDADGRAVLTLAGPPRDATIVGAAVTVEPIGGSAQPTTTPILAGSLDER